MVQTFAILTAPADADGNGLHLKQGKNIKTIQMFCELKL